jgi:XTP/dITP diphosphohydrolase
MHVGRLSQVRGRLLVASNNTHKLTEFARILGPLGIETVSPADLGIRLEVDETGTSFAENAALKAEAFARTARMPAAADDSGIVVDALGGEPGVYSARFGGPGLSDRDRTALLLERMRGVPDGERTGRFVSAIALAVPGEETRLFHGEVEGTIAHTARGENGFGYDPVFYYAPFGATFGEVGPEQKDSVSHRARALQALAAFLGSAQGASILG